MKCLDTRQSTLSKLPPIKNGHLDLVPAFLHSCSLTLCKTDISLRRKLSAGPKGVRLRESWLESPNLIHLNITTVGYCPHTQKLELISYETPSDLASHQPPLFNFIVTNSFWPCQQDLKVSLRLLDFGELEKEAAWIEVNLCWACAACC